MTADEKGEALTVRGFSVIDAGKDWHLRCDVCGKGWALKKTSNHPGNMLHLLNHRASHEARSRPEGT